MRWWAVARPWRSTPARRGWPSPPTRPRRGRPTARRPPRAAAWASSRRARRTSPPPKPARGPPSPRARAPSAGYARATFDKRFAGLPAAAGARVAFDPKPLLAQRSPQAADTTWGRSLRDGAAVLTTSGAEGRVPFRISADPIGLKPADLPLATGPQPPQARGSAPLVVGLRDPAQTLAFARPAGLLQPLDLLDQLPGFLKPDLTNLGPNGTVTSTGLDLDHLTARFEPPDSGDWATKLGRIDTLAGLAGKAILGGLSIEHRDGAYTLTSNGDLVARVGVYGKALVLSNDPSANLPAAAAAPAAPTPPGAAGALTARLRSSVLATQIPELVRARVGDLTAWARAGLTGVTGEVRLAVGWRPRSQTAVRGCVEGIGEELGLVRHQTVGDLHDAHRVGRRTVVGDDALADPDVRAA